MRMNKLYKKTCRKEEKWNIQIENEESVVQSDRMAKATPRFRGDECSRACRDFLRSPLHSALRCGGEGYPSHDFLSSDAIDSLMIEQKSAVSFVVFVVIQ